MTLVQGVERTREYDGILEVIEGGIEYFLSDTSFGGAVEDHLDFLGLEQA